MTKVVWGSGIRIGAAALLLAGVSSCGDLTRQGTSPAVLVITELVAAPGAEPTKFGATLFSDVFTVVDDRAGVWADLGRVSFELHLKDPGAASSTITPTSTNSITLDRYHVSYSRADGRNTPGVDVPYGFDGAFTFTVSGGTSMSETFELVRHVAKEEAPLAALVTSPLIINTIAEVTFFGHDQTGRSVSTTAHMGIEFGNFGDPK
jgi:hypothetical protein